MRPVAQGGVFTCIDLECIRSTGCDVEIIERFFNLVDTEANATVISLDDLDVRLKSKIAQHEILCFRGTDKSCFLHNVISSICKPTRSSTRKARFVPFITSAIIGERIVEHKGSSIGWIGVLCTVSSCCGLGGRMHYRCRRRVHRRIIGARESEKASANQDQYKQSYTGDDSNSFALR